MTNITSYLADISISQPTHIIPAQLHYGIFEVLTAVRMKLVVFGT
jgi:hypothetical protein